MTLIYPCEKCGKWIWISWSTLALEQGFEKAFPRCECGDKK
jgi:hypothetical protein